MSFDNEDMIEVYGFLEKETPTAWGVKFEEDTFGKEAEIIWLPKSQCTYNGGDTFEVPHWMVIEKGLDKWTI